MGDHVDERYGGTGATGHYLTPTVEVSDLGGLLGPPDGAAALQQTLAALDGIELLRVFEYIVRDYDTGGTPPGPLLLMVRRELMLRVGAIPPDLFDRLLTAARLQPQTSSVEDGLRETVRYGEPTCAVCGANAVDWGACDTGEPCPQGCGGTIHAADGDYGCSNYYARIRNEGPLNPCSYHGSADDGLRQHEGADSPAGVRYHDPERHDLE